MGVVWWWELPPRARRIPDQALDGGGCLGTTSACAENTEVGGKSAGHGWNYLRVRGEYQTKHLGFSQYRELPPRARRILYQAIKSGKIQGTTSACAENTPIAPAYPLSPGNYLRVRGEYTPCRGLPRQIVELPPRARRIRCGFTIIRIEHGTTSACAENTGRSPTPMALHWNYLRVRGEYLPPFPAGLILTELPPRARRILMHPAITRRKPGTTSACAENTTLSREQVSGNRNYLRVRGEYPK